MSNIKAMTDDRFRVELAEAESHWRDKQFAGLRRDDLQGIWVRVWAAWKEAERRGMPHK